MAIFGGLLRNPMIMLALASTGKKGRLAAALLSGVDKSFEAIKEEKQGKTDFLDLALSLGEVGAEVAGQAKKAGIADITIVNDALQENIGMGTSDAISRLRQLKQKAKTGSIDQIKLSARLAAAKKLHEFNDDDD